MSTKEASFQQHYSHIAMENGREQTISGDLFGRLRKAVSTASFEPTPLLDVKNVLFASQSDNNPDSSSRVSSGEVSGGGRNPRRFGRRKLFLVGWLLEH